MDLEKIAEASHQAWFVAMAKQGWIFGPRLNPDFKTHPWLKPYGSLDNNVKEIVRAQVRGTLAALEAQGAAPAIAQSPPPSPPVKPAAVEKPVESPPPSPPPAPKPSANGLEVLEVLDRKADSSGRMRIGTGLVKKAELLASGGTQVAIIQQGKTVEVIPAEEGPATAFFASVNPDGFMLPKAILSGTGATDFILTVMRGKLLVEPK